MIYQKIAVQIIELKEKDLAVRAKLIKNKQLGKGYNKEMEKVHIENAILLNKIIDDIGYPTITKVGKSANEAAWLIIQHAISQPLFMKKCLQLLKNAVENKEANPISLAYLSDRIAKFEDRPQLYGTQFDWDENGDLNPHPFDNLEKVNQRRKALGLNTLEEQILIIRQQSKKENESPPNDLVKRQERYNQWRKKVGWIK